MKKTLYNLLFLTILFHIFLDASDNQAEVLRLQTKNELNWKYITHTVFSCHNFPKILQPLQDSDPEIHRIIGNNLGLGCHQRLPISYGRDRKCMSDPIVFNSVQKTIIDNIIADLNRYALGLKHQQTKKSEPTPEELAQAAEKFAAAAVAADKAMQDFLAEEAQKRSIAGAAKKNNGKSKKPKNKK